MRVTERARRRAQALVGFVLVLPLFLVLLFAVIDFARLLFTYISLANGAREMARVASISTDTNVNAAVDAFNNYTAIAGAVNPATDSVTVSVYGWLGVSQGSTTCALPLTRSCVLPSRVAASGGYVDVAASYTFLFAVQFRAPFGVAFMNPNARLTTATRAYVE